MRSDRSWGNPERMLGVDDALARILAQFAPLTAVETPIGDALGMVVERPIVSTVDVPPFRNSAMDGYAVRAADTEPSPCTLRVIGVVAAGSTPDRPLNRFEAMRIMTGAPVPDGADAVVRFEETDEHSRGTLASLSEISITRSVSPGENVRLAGEDIRTGQLVISVGTCLGPEEIGILASLNLATVPVHRRPQVAILATGDEVVEIGPDLRPGQIRNSNSHTLAALVRRAGAEPIPLGIARDTADDLRAKLASAPSPDLILTAGGVSVGDYDVVKDVLRRDGRIDIWQVRMKPGKPLAFGTIGGIPLLGLPGNPVAAHVSFEQFARPAVRRMLGHARLSLDEVEAKVTTRLMNTGRRHFVRAIVRRTPSGLVVSPIAERGSAILTSVAGANCYIVVPETAEVIEAGSTVKVQVFDGERFV